jgi:hypothetical protein
MEFTTFYAYVDVSPCWGILPEECPSNLFSRSDGLGTVLDMEYPG